MYPLAEQNNISFVIIVKLEFSKHLIQQSTIYIRPIFTNISMFEFHLHIDLFNICVYQSLTIIK